MKLHSIWSGWSMVLYIDILGAIIYSRLMFSAKMKDWTLDETPSSRLSVYFDRSQRDRFKRPLHEKKSLSHNLSFSFYYTQVLDDNSHQLVIIMYFATRNVEFEGQPPRYFNRFANEVSRDNIGKPRQTFSASHTRLSHTREGKRFLQTRRIEIATERAREIRRNTRRTWWLTIINSCVRDD